MKLSKHCYLIFVIFASILCGTSSHAEIPCSGDAYIIDADPHGTNLREAPDGHAKIIRVIPRDKVGGTFVRIAGYSNGWIHVNEFFDTTDEFKPKKINGWIHARLLGTNSEVGDGVRLYTLPHKTSKNILFPPVSVGFRLLSCQDDWIQVETISPNADYVKEAGEEFGRKRFLIDLRKRKTPLTGWLPKYGHCPNPLTTCP